MAVTKDFLTNCADCFIKLFQSDSIVASYPWTEWDSDAPVQMPRGFLNIQSDSSLIDAFAPQSVRVEVVLEGKPKRQKLSAVAGQLQGLLMNPKLHNVLNSYANGSVQFFYCAESMTVRQSIEGDLRVRRINFVIQAIPLL
jgi:hypothetical protein